MGALVRGLSMRDVESLCEQTGLGKLSKSTARMCEELRARFEAFKRRNLYDINLVALYLDATFISVRPSGPKEGVLVAWGFTDAGERILLAVTLGMRESYEDWLALGRDLIARGLGAPMLIVGRRRAGRRQGDRAVLAGVRPPTLLCPPRAEPVTRNCPSESANGSSTPTGRRFDDAINANDAKKRLQTLVDQLDKDGYTAAANASPTISTRSSSTCDTRPDTAARWRSTNLLERSLGEVKRRTKVIGRFPREDSCLIVVWAVLDLAA